MHTLRFLGTSLVLSIALIGFTGSFASAKSDATKSKAAVSAADKQPTTETGSDKSDDGGGSLRARPPTTGAARIGGAHSPQPHRASSSGKDHPKAKAKAKAHRGL